MESSREELEEKREPKRLAFSVGETAIVSSEQKKGRKARFTEVIRDTFG